MIRLAAILAGFVLPGMAAADCWSGLKSHPEIAALVCPIQARLPFVTTARWIGDPLAFASRDRRFDNGFSIRAAQAFRPDGTPYRDRAEAQAALARFARRTECEIRAVRFNSGRALAFDLACRIDTGNRP